MFMLHYLYKFFKTVFVTNKKAISILTANISSSESVLLNLLLMQQVLFKVFLKVYRVLFRVSISNLLSKKKKIGQNNHSLSFIVTRCHSLYHSLSLVVLLVVPLVTIRCHSLSFIATRCTTHCNSLLLVVTLFKNDRFLAPDFVYYFKEKNGMIAVPVKS